ncbi:hypothetical protein JOD97_004143 [Duganella sp. 1411]|uniref:hypothetical protein n=1 Tax=Duganella sp. 1411 TaxID=2806572 RepID=UPI001AEA15C4|nr:hypothetical protein [Duganella sp. 1411]MBP1206081.1 hypothetical protein [Duganella sp. 1411]
MSLVSNCTKFLEDLIMGDFNEDQMVSAQIIGGLISLIPVIDQVMDLRDVSGSLYRINKHGGFAKATIDQKIYLGFAAFGVVPEVGSAFKTVFKPLYKERKALKGAVNSGVAMIERMLSKKKGGALAWVKALDWAGNTQAAIVQANLALESCIALLDYIAVGHWWCPDHLEQLARDVSPGIKKMRGQLAGPIREASGYIKQFVTELLGEHAAAVVMAVASNAGSIPRGGHHGAAPRAASGNSHLRVADKPRLNGRTTKGKIASVVQRTAFQAYQGLEQAAKGLLGEHIVDHHVIEQKGWGLSWNRHDMIGGPGKKAAGWQSEFKKLNDNEIPLYLCTPSVHVLTNGIDSLWLTNRPRPHQFAVVEAKASINPAAKLLSLLGEAKGAGGSSTINTGRKKNRTPGASMPSSSASTNGPKSGMVMQMSRQWILDRIDKEFGQYKGRMTRGGTNYSRHVFLVSPLQAADHMIAMEKIVSEGLISKPAAAQKYAPEHSRHDIQKEFGEKDLDAAEAQYKISGKPSKPKKPKK